jgi:hypothetical protein
MAIRIFNYNSPNGQKVDKSWQLPKNYFYASHFNCFSCTATDKSDETIRNPWRQLSDTVHAYQDVQGPEFNLQHPKYFRGKGRGREWRGKRGKKGRRGAERKKQIMKENARSIKTG